MVTKVVRLDHGEENHPGSGEPLLTPGDGNSRSACAVLHAPRSVLTYINQQSPSFTERSLAPMTLGADPSSLYFRSDHVKLPRHTQDSRPPPHCPQLTIQLPEPRINVRVGAKRREETQVSPQKRDVCHHSHF